MNFRSREPHYAEAHRHHFPIARLVSLGLLFGFFVEIVAITFDHHEWKLPKNFHIVPGVPLPIWTNRKLANVCNSAKDEVGAVFSNRWLNPKRIYLLNVEVCDNRSFGKPIPIREFATGEKPAWASLMHKMCKLHPVTEKKFFNRAFAIPTARLNGCFQVIEVCWIIHGCYLPSM